MSEKIIKEGGYQPTQDPPRQPPAEFMKPSGGSPDDPTPEAPVDHAGSGDGGGGDS